MAENKDIGLKFTVDSGDAKKTIGELRKEFTDLQTVINNSKAGSEDFNKAIHRLGEVKGSIKDVKEQMMALDPDERARAFSALGQTIIGGFTAAKGAAALFGAGQEDIEKAILKVQGATALLQGFQSVADAQKQLNIIKIIALQKIDLLNTTLQGAAESKNIIIRNLATAAQWALNVAMNANPIGLLIAGVAALAGAYYLLSGTSEKVLQTSKELNEELDKENKLRKEIAETNRNKAELSAGGIKDIENEIKILKARGATAEEVTAKEILLAQKRFEVFNGEIAENRKALGERELAYQTYLDNVGELTDEKEIEEHNKKIDIFKKDIKDLKDQNLKLLSDQRTAGADEQLVELNAQNEKQKIIDEANKKAEAKRKEEAEKIKLQKIADQKTAKELEEKFYLESIADKDRRETETLRKELEKERARIEELKISTEEKQKLNEDLENIYQLKLETILSDRKKTKDELKAKEDEEEYNNELRQQELIDQSRQRDQQKELADKKATEEAKQLIVKSGFDGLTSLGQIFIGNSKKLEAFNKGIALTQIAIDTAQAISSLTKNSEGNPANLLTGGLAGIAQFTSGLARILANIAKAKSLLSGSGSTSAPSLSSGGGGVGGGLQSQGGQLQQPTANVFINPASTTFGNNQGGRLGRSETQDIRVFVTETDITRTQDKIDKINRRATIQ